MKPFLSKHAVAFYFLSTLAISWGGILLVVGGPAGFTGTTAKDDPRFLLVYLAMLAGPVVSSLLLMALVDGRPGFRELISRLCTWRVGVRWYAFSLLIAPLVLLLVLLPLSIVSPGFTPGLFVSSDKAALIAFGLAVGLGAGIFEELGWTGFAIPRLLRNHSPLATGLIVGVFWAVWHVVAALWGMGAIAGSIPIAVFVAVDLLTILPAYRVLMVWGYARTNSLLASMLMHASLTSSLLILGPAAQSGAGLLLMDVLVAAACWIVVALAGRAIYTSRDSI